MKFLCLECDEVMPLDERQIPGDGTLAAVFRCGACGREIAMLTNPMETRIVSSMGVKIGGRTVPEQPMELVRSNLAEGREDAFDDPGPPTPTEGGPPDAVPPDGARDSGDTPGAPAEPHTAPAGPESPGAVRWSPAARERLEQVPRFVRGMVKRIYSEYAWERGIEEFTPELMDQARADLGLEGM